MALSTSPRKVVPLSSGDDWRPPKFATGPGVTKRVFFCGVVVEGSENGKRLPEDVQDLVVSLGEPLDSGPSAMISSSLSDPSVSDRMDADRPLTRKRALTDTSALSDVISELVATERSYVNRLRSLKYDYADPLRKFSRSKDTSILPAYEAKILFGNIDALLPVNEAFLADLEKMLLPNGFTLVGSVGEVALRHFRDLKGFEQYKQYYIKREEAQTIFEREMAKRSSGFAAYIDRIKYSSSETKNRVGLRELLINPVQRIPQYTLLFRTMIKYMAPSDPQRALLVEADEVASKIALAETDEQTKRAAIMYCLSATVEGFPPGLISNSRKFIDCIDVEDILSDSSFSSGTSSVSGSAGGSSLHCTLFLFDDKLVIAKRPGNGEKGGRTLTGLDTLDKLTKAGGLPQMLKKSGMSFKGVVDVTDVVATDVGGADVHLYLESPPNDQTDRWSGRPFRALSVVHPPCPINLDPTRTAADKKRFLENLWRAQAEFRKKDGQSVILLAEEREVENKSGRSTLARCFYNVYQRTTFLREAKKTKVVLHIDASGSADPLPFGMNAPPFVVIRVQPLAGELCRYAVTSSDPNDEGEEDVVQTARVPSRVVQTIHQFGLFKFKTGNNSLPSTPTASSRSRSNIFGLDAISRNLFNARPGSSMGDFFGGSVNGHKRNKSTASRSSMYTQSTQTTSTGDGSLMKFSHRSNSTATNATTVSTMDEDHSFNGNRSLSRSKKLFSRGKSPGRGGGVYSESEVDRESPNRSSKVNSSIRSRSLSRDRTLEYSDDEDELRSSHIRSSTMSMDESQWELNKQLELARRNSESQHAKALPTLDPLEQPIEDIIYEEEPPQPIRRASSSSEIRSDTSHETLQQRPPSRASRSSTYSVSTYRPDFDLATPTRSTFDSNLSQHSRPSSQHSSERRLFGPRSPSPLPRVRSPQPFASVLELPLPSMDFDLALETTLVNVSTAPPTPTADASHSNIINTSTRTPISNLPRSKRQPLLPTMAADNTPKSKPGTNQSSNASQSSTIEPLSIKKKTSLRSSPSGTPTPSRKAYTRSSPMSRTTHRIVSPRSKLSPQVRNARNASSPYTTGEKVEGVEKLLQLSLTTKEDVESSRRAIKRMKLEIDEFSINASAPPSSDDEWRSSSPDKGVKTPQKVTPMTRAAQERLDEMRQLIGKRDANLTPVKRHRSFLSEGTGSNNAQVDHFTRSLEQLLSTADSDLAKVSSNQATLHTDIQKLAVELKEKSSDLDKTRVELQNSKRQCELVKSLLTDATAEKEIMYEAFNEELDGMYNDANLPEDEAWQAMSRDLKKTKEARNALTKESSELKRRLAEAEMQRDEWGALLRAHGLIP